MKFGAEGVGLCRTEHMFMDPDRLPWVQKMIIAGTPEARREALDKLLPMQYSDFYAMFKAIGEKPMTVRLFRSSSSRVPSFKRRLNRRSCYTKSFK